MTRMLLACCLLLAGCGAAATPDATTTAFAPQSMAACRVPADGAGPVADRGIGGTGIGDGGTRVTDRGIGGTGIVGTITGFASVCVNGLEVAYDPAVSVAVDGARQSLAALRVGQVAAIAARHDGAGLRADLIAIRHEVSGPVEAVAADGSQAVVAGQTVLLGPDMIAGRDQVAPGRWVAVSGLRDPTGTIAATRIDTRAPGPVSVTGRIDATLTGSGGDLRIGGMHLLPGRMPGGIAAAPGGTVTVTGDYTRRGLVVDALVAAPALPFADSVTHFVVQAFVQAHGAGLRLGTGLDVAVADSFGALPDHPALSVVEIHSNSLGDLVATGHRDAGAPDRAAAAGAAAHAAPARSSAGTAASVAGRAAAGMAAGAAAGIAGPAGAIAEAPGNPGHGGGGGGGPHGIAAGAGGGGMGVGGHGPGGPGGGGPGGGGPGAGAAAGSHR